MRIKLTRIVIQNWNFLEIQTCSPEDKPYTFEGYLENMQKPGTFAGLAEVIAFSLCYKKAICIFYGKNHDKLQSVVGSIFLRKENVEDAIFFWRFLAVRPKATTNLW